MHRRGLKTSLESHGSDANLLSDTSSSSYPTNGIITAMDPVFTSQRATKSDGSLPILDRLLCKLFDPIRSNLENLRGVSKEEVTDMLAAAKTMRKELIKIGSYVTALSSDPECTEDDNASLW